MTAFALDSGSETGCFSTGSFQAALFGSESLLALGPSWSSSSAGCGALCWFERKRAAGRGEQFSIAAASTFNDPK